jgi:PKHD-type hydroxylase
MMLGGNSVHYGGMILCVANVLSSVQLREMSAWLEDAMFQESLDALGGTACTKRRVQLHRECPVYEKASRLVRTTILENEMLRTAALPHTLSTLAFGRTDPGMGSGSLVDLAVLSEPRMRVDLAFTLFLSEPSDYEGGELVLVGNDGDEEIKLPAGALVLHPASSVHRIRTVRSGRRYACMGFIQSLVRDPRVREMLFDLSRVKLHLFRDQGNAEMFDLAAKTQSNLLRMHAEV